MIIVGGRIICGNGNENEENSYRIQSVSVELDQDKENELEIYRCISFIVESDASSKINLEAGRMLCNEFAGEEYDDADGSGCYREEARKEISKRTGVNIAQVVIN